MKFNITVCEDSAYKYYREDGNGIVYLNLDKTEVDSLIDISLKKGFEVIIELASLEG